MRLGLVASEQIPKRARDLTRSDAALKSRQRTSSVSGVLSYDTQTADEWDLNPLISGSNVFNEIEVVFTGSGNQTFPIITFYYDLFIDGTSENNRLNAGVAYGVYTDGVVTAVMQGTQYDITYAESPYQYRWTLRFTLDGTAPYYFKAYTVGSDEGTIAVTRLS